MKGKGWKRGSVIGIWDFFTQDIKILHFEGSLHLLMSVWSKEYYWTKQHWGGRWMCQVYKWKGAISCLRTNVSRNEKNGFKWELWNNLWVRVNVKTRQTPETFLLLILTWFSKGRRERVAGKSGDWDAIIQGVPSSLCSYFPMFLTLLLSHLLDLAVLTKSSLIQNAAKDTLPAWFDCSWFAWHFAGYTLYLRG